MLQVIQLMGRPFIAAEQQRGDEQVAIISENLWEELFDRNANVLGRTVRLDDVDRTVIGVLPRGAAFGTVQILGTSDAYGRSFAERGHPNVDVWLPLRPGPLLRWENHGLFVVGRLKEWTTTASAQDELTAIAADLATFETTIQSDRSSCFMEPGGSSSGLSETSRLGGWQSLRPPRCICRWRRLRRRARCS
jgi:MacB-like periplasmic core domain